MKERFSLEAQKIKITIERPRESYFLWARSKARANSGKQPLKNHWKKIFFNSATKELKHILSLWSHIKSLPKWFLKQLLSEESTFPLVVQRAFEWGNSKRSPRGYSPFIQQILWVHFPTRDLGRSGIPRAPCAREARSPVEGGDRYEQSSADTQEKESVGLHGWSGRASLSASNTIACFPQRMMTAGPAPDLSRCLPEAQASLTLTVKKQLEEGEEKSAWYRAGVGKPFLQRAR